MAEMKNTIVMIKDNETKMTQNLGYKSKEMGNEKT